MDLLTHEQRNFLHEYGPALIDVLLAIPLVQYLLSLYRRARNQPHGPPGPAPLLELPDELVVMIMEYFTLKRHHRLCAPDWRRRAVRNSFSQVNKRFRGLMAPLLYKDIAVVQGWSRANRALASLQHSRGAQQNAETFKLALHIRPGTGWMPTTSLAPRLAGMLPLFERLGTLHLHVPPEHVPEFSSQFRKHSLHLPGIRSLVLGPNMHFIIAYCPNVKSIATVGRQWVAPASKVGSLRHDNPFDRPQTAELIFAVGFTENLRHFELFELWEAEYIQALQRATPDLESLAMLGHGCPEGPFPMVAPLRTFTNLKDLVLPHIHALEVVFHRQGLCRNALFGHGGRSRSELMSRREERKALEAARPVANMIFQHLSGLQRLWIGDRMLFTPVRNHSSPGVEVEFKYEEREKPATLRE